VSSVPAKVSSVPATPSSVPVKKECSGPVKKETGPFKMHYPLKKPRSAPVMSTSVTAEGGPKPGNFDSSPLKEDTFPSQSEVAEHLSQFLCCLIGFHPC
jgi:hypothetical protein